MIVVIFEVSPMPGLHQEYIDAATVLRPLLNQIDGFVSIERFESLSIPGKILSLSFWRDEQAVQKWRTLPKHRQAQLKGRESIFSDYRLRVANVNRDYTLTDREEVPTDR